MSATKNSNETVTNNAHSPLGQVGELPDGRRYVIFKRLLSHPVEKVWATITDPAKLAHWFPGFKVELRQGGRFDIWFDGDGSDGGESHVNGEVTRYEPPKVLECGTLRFELEAQAAGCLLTFTDILWNEGSGLSPEALANSVLAGWHVFLDSLDDALAGRKVDLNRMEFDYSTVDVPGR